LPAGLDRITHVVSGTRMDLANVLDVVIQVASALGAAHKPVSCIAMSNRKT